MASDNQKIVEMLTGAAGDRVFGDEEIVALAGRVLAARRTPRRVMTTPFGIEVDFAATRDDLTAVLEDLVLVPDVDSIQLFPKGIIHPEEFTFRFTLR